MYFNKVRFRAWLRNKFHIGVDADEHERGYLHEFPWLEQYIPLGKIVYRTPKTGSSGIRVQKINGRELLSTALGCGDTYLVDENGALLTRVRKGFLTGKINGRELLTPEVECGHVYLLDKLEIFERRWFDWELVIGAFARLPWPDQCRVAYIIKVDTGVIKSAQITIYRLRPPKGLLPFEYAAILFSETQAEDAKLRAQIAEKQQQKISTAQTRARDEWAKV